jgi:beta-barrel assembly-enhancing protease
MSWALWPLLVAATFVSGVSAITLVSVDQEIEIGRQTNLQVRKQMSALQDRQTVDYVNDLGRRLVRFAPGPKYPYSFSVANYREVNAFALPGGPIWVHRGVLHAATNESQVAGVIAHEIAHIAQRHAANQLTNATLTNLGLGLLGAILGNSGGASAAQTAAGLLANGVFLKFSRDDEREADKVGLTMLTRAGWDGRGMVELFEILRKEGQRDPGSLEVFLSSHPSPQERINELRADVTRRAKGKRDSAEFQAIRARVLKLPPPRKMPQQ